MNFINVGKENSASVDLYYEDHGAGKTIVLVHGWPLSSRSWEKQVSVLVNAGYRIITYDRRGFGYSSRPLLSYDFDTLAGDLQEIISKLGLRDITLVGFSTGGGEVAHYIGKYGTRHVSRAVFISAVTPFLLKTPDNPDGVDESAFDGIMNGIIADRPAFLTNFFNDFYNVDILLNKRISEDAVRMSWNMAESASFSATLDCIPSLKTDFRSDLRQFDIPTLVIHGESDRIVPFSAAGKRMPEYIRGCKLVVLKDAPHGLIWTHAEEVNRELLNFLGAENKVAKPTIKVGSGR